MKKDLVAVYLNEHPEFFNEYPELLQKIQAIDHNDLPLEPLQTLSIADRIIKRAHDDKEHMKSRLEWFVEIIEANESLQENLFEIERVALTTPNLPTMLCWFCEEFSSRFNLPKVQVFLVDGPNPFGGENLKEKINGISKDRVGFVDLETLNSWVPEVNQPVLRSELNGASKIFGKTHGDQQINSEILIPILFRDQLVGALCMGSSEPYRFYDGLRTDFLVRTVEKLGIAIDNLIVLEKFKEHFPTA